MYAGHYRLSVYAHLPIWTKIAIFGIIAVSIVATVLLLYLRSRRLAVYTLLPTLVVFGFLPYLAQQLGYLTRYGDPITHAGYIRDVVATGEAPPIIYPFLHVLGSAVAQVAALPAYTALELLNVVMILSLVLCFGLFARYARLPVAAVLLFVPLIVSSNITPAVFTYSTVFLLSSYVLTRAFFTSSAAGGFDRPDVRLIVLLLVSSVIWIYHIIPTSVLLTIIASSMVLSIPLIRRVASRIVPTAALPTAKSSVLRQLLFVFLLLGFLWMVRTWLFRRSLFLSLAVFGLNEVQPGNLSATTITDALFGTFGFTLVDVAVLALKRFGNLGVLFGFACIGSLLYVLRRETRHSLPAFVLLAVPFAAVWSVEEFVISAIPSISFLRALRPGQFLAPLLAGYCLWILLRTVRSRVQWRSSKFVAVGLVLLIIVAGTGIAARNSYASPWTLNKNGYFVDSDAEGMEWYYAYKDQSVNTTTLWRSNDRWMDYLMRPEQRESRAEELHYNLETNEYRAPPHFGYANNTTFGESVGCEYYIEGSYGRGIYLTAWESLGEFDRSDFARLRADPTVNQLYANGNVNVSTISCK